MPIQTLVEEGDRVVFRVDGAITAEQAVDAIMGHYSQTPTKFCIWDLSEASLSEIAHDKFQMIVEAVAEFADARGPGARTALVPGWGALPNGAFLAVPPLHRGLVTAFGNWVTLRAPWRASLSSPRTAPKGR